MTWNMASLLWYLQNCKQNVFAPYFLIQGLPFVYHVQVFLQTISILHNKPTLDSEQQLLTKLRNTEFQHNML